MANQFCQNPAIFALSDLVVFAVDGSIDMIEVKMNRIFVWNGLKKCIPVRSMKLKNNKSRKSVRWGKYIVAINCSAEDANFIITLQQVMNDDPNSTAFATIHTHIFLSRLTLLIKIAVICFHQFKMILPLQGKLTNYWMSIKHSCVYIWQRSLLICYF